MRNQICQDALAQVRVRLVELAEDRYRTGVQRFFKEPVTALGVRTPQLYTLAKELHRSFHAWPTTTRDQFANALWKEDPLEFGILACLFYRHFEKSFGEREFRLFERWLHRGVRNWGQCDALSLYLLAPTIAHQPVLASELPAWTKSDNRWVRRAAAAALVREARAGRSTAVILRVASSLAPDPDDIVRKGAAWVLKDAYPAKPREVMALLMKNRLRWPRLVLRTAAEKMPESAKETLLEKWENERT